MAILAAFGLYAAPNCSVEMTTSWMLWTLEDRPDKAQGFPTRFKKGNGAVVQIDPARPRYWIPVPEIWAPIARTVASPMPKPAAKGP